MRSKYINMYNVEIISLILFIINGIIDKFLISINRSLNSDEVGPGMVSLEIWRHKDYLLSQYYFNAADPNIFSDILPFHLIPQIISNFNPYAIRIMVFIIFLLVIFIFSYLIYEITGNIINGLIFAALLANLSSGSFWFFSMPQSHNGTLFFVGIFLLLFLNKKLEINLTWVLSIFLLNLMVFSDSIIVAWFVIPFTAIYILFFKDKDFKSNLSILIMNLTTLVTYMIKTFFISTFVEDQLYIKDFRTIFDVNIPLYIKGLLYLLNDSVYSIYETPNLSSYIIICSFVLLLYYSNKYMMVTQNMYSKKLYFFFIISAIIVFLGYVCTNLAADFTTTRYLTLTALSIYALISVSYNKKYIYTLLIFLILFSSAISNYTFIKNLDYQPNQPQLGLIENLKDNGLQYGVGDYWDSNIITYLSNEQVIIRQVFIYNGAILPRLWLSSERWFSDKSINYTKFFIIFRANDTLKMNELRLFLAHNQPIETKSYGDYTIYVYNQVA
jgi:hypothetical protein